MQQHHRCCAGGASTSCAAGPAAAAASAGPTAQRSCAQQQQHGRQHGQQERLQCSTGSDERQRRQQHQRHHTRPLRRGFGPAPPPLLLLLLSLGLCGLLLPPFQHAAAQHVDTLRRACLQKIQLSLVNTFDLYLSGFTGKVALIDVSTHPNLGDTMLWHGAKRILFHWERTPDVLCAFTPSVTQNATFPRCPSPVQLLTLLANNTANSLILWHPAGNWGDIGLKFHAMRTKYIQALDEALSTNPLFARHNSTFIQLPQSVYYSHSDVAAEDKKIFTSLKRLQFVLYTHSMDSFEMLQDNLALSSERAIAHHAPDMAFALGPIQSLYPHAFDIVIVFKIDHESAETHLTEQSPYERVIQQATAALQGLKNPAGQPVTFKVTDWRLELGKDRAQAMFADLSDVRLNTAIRIISQGKVVVTNRLHGAVAATLIGRPNFWFEGESLGLQNFAKLSNTLRRARDSAPTMCREDNLRSYEVTGANEEEAFRSALRQAADLLDSLDDLI